MTASPFSAARPTSSSFTSTEGAPLATDRQMAFLRSLLTERAWSTDAMPRMSRHGQVTKAEASAAISYLLECPREAAPAPAADAPEVADGRYALELDGKLRFFHVNTPTEGRWAGYTFVKEQAGGDVYRVGSAERRRAIRAAIAADPEALARYGKTLGTCGRCGRELTDETSRELGLGPVCRAK